MMTKTEHLSRPASGSFDGNSRPLGEAMRFCMIRAPRRAWLVGLGLAVGIILAAGGSATADQRPPPCSSLANPPSVFKILDNQTYALCAVASCLVFNGVAYCKCDVKTGDSISLSLKFDDDQDVCTVNAEGVNNGYMVSTFSGPDSLSRTAIWRAIPAPRVRMGPMPNSMAGFASKAPRGSHIPVSMSPWRKTRSFAPVRSPSRARRTRWAIKSPALIPARNRSSRTARKGRPTRTLARRSMSALQPVPATFWPSSSLARFNPRTSALYRAIETDTALWRLDMTDRAGGGEHTPDAAAD